MFNKFKPAPNNVPAEHSEEAAEPVAAEEIVVVNNPFRILEYWQMTETADLTEFKMGRYALDPTETAVA